MMRRKMKSPLLLSFFSLAFVSGMSLTPVTPTVIRCHEAERQALLDLKQRLDDPSNRLASWVGKDCCAWEGVGCSNITAHVIKLDLRRHASDGYTLEGYMRDAYIWDGDIPNGVIFIDMNRDSDKFSLHGDISTDSSLQSFQHLTHLDLSGNDFSGHTIPAFLGSFGRLTYLNLSNARFIGKVPDQLGNLSTLRHLDLSYNWYFDYDYYRDTSRHLYVENPGWIARLTSLRHLNMNYVKFGSAPNWFQALNALPHIEDVELVRCNLIGPLPHSPPHLNFTSLRTLNLADNLINGTEPGWLYNITTLESLDFSWNDIYWSSTHGSILKLTSLRTLYLSRNSISKNFLPSLSNLCKLQILSLSGVLIKDEPSNLKMVFSGCLMYNLEELYLDNIELGGSVPEWLETMKNLKKIDLSSNLLDGSILNSLGSLTSLQYLDLSDNKLNGTIGESIGQLKNLVHLDLSYNSLSLSLIHLANLSSLKYLDISSNTLLINDTNDWMPRFQLQDLHMDNCKIVPSPHFPKWLQTQKSLSTLSLSNGRIQGTIPSWFPSSLKYLYLSGNMIDGKLMHFFPNLTELDLSYNSFSGHLHLQMADMMPSLESLYLSNNKFTKFTIEMLQNFTKLKALDLSNNLFSGHLPLQMGNMMPSLQDLSLYNNKFTGEVSQNFTKLQHLDLSNNLFSGHLSLQMGNMMPSLYMLYLSNNKFTKFTIEMLQNFTKLQVLDLSNNLFSGHLPLQMGNMMPSLLDLSVHNNKFTGEVSQNFTKLQYLDLSNNLFSGHLPLQMGNMMPSLYMLYLSNNKFTGEVSQNFTKLQYLDLSNNSFSGHLPLQMGNMMPSLEQLYLSNNNFIGEVPQNFTMLQVLDLSNNLFSGHLNPTISNTFSNLHYLDLSMNNFTGSIPHSFCQINLLDKLRLSHNKFSGELPNCWNSSSGATKFDFSNNQFHGEIPNTFCILQSIQSLHLSYNLLSGRIPLCLQDCRNLVILDVGHNNFTGNIPTWSTNSLPCLRSLSLRFNSLTGTIPKLSHLSCLQILDISNNNLSGSIPTSFGNFIALKSSVTCIDNVHSRMHDKLLLRIKGIEYEYESLLTLVTFIDLSNNGLSGYIPKELVDLQGLHNLNLCGNKLIGEIPRDIGGMQNLEVLDLSRNSLSGTIPSSLANLKFLNNLNLSYNNLSGDIPLGKQLQTFGPSSYIGNPYLCGPPLIKKCTNDNVTNGLNEENKDDNGRKEIIWLFTSITLGFIIGFWGIFGTLLMHKRWRILYLCAIDSRFDKLYTKIPVKIRRKLL